MTSEEIFCSVSLERLDIKSIVMIVFLWKSCLKNLRHPRERFLFSNEVPLDTNQNLTRWCLRFVRLALLPVFDSFSH